MKDRYKAKGKGLNITILCVIYFVLFPCALYSFSPPLDVPLLLSGNFGELRSGHFHSGIDFKTQGVTGLPVRAVEAGYISRISVSPTSYGRAVYIAHDDGTTSVYGHLDHFSTRIESAVRDSQYSQESFAVNLHFEPQTFPLKQGETFAYSGNTGSSGGPHLHFELRDTQTDRPFDALPFFKNQIRDNIPPEIREIKLFPIDRNGVIINDSVAWGKIGVGIKAYDRMNGTRNIYGVKEIVLKLDGQEIFHSLINDFSFDDTRYINSFIDWQAWRNNREFFMKSFIDAGNQFDIYKSSGTGIITVDEEREYKLEYRLTDAFGNVAVKKFTVRGQKADPSPTLPNETVFYWNQNNYSNRNGIEIFIPAGSLYANVYFDENAQNLPSAPLHRPCQLTLKVADDSCPDKSKYGIAAVRENKLEWIGGKYHAGKISADIRELGDYTTVADTVPPTIIQIKPQKATDKIMFRIKDDLSGIASYRATIDGQFTLFEYDAKTGLLFSLFDAKYRKSGILRIEVWDRAGNCTLYPFHTAF